MRSYDPLVGTGLCSNFGKQIWEHIKPLLDQLRTGEYVIIMMPSSLSYRIPISSANDFKVLGFLPLECSLIMVYGGPYRR